jgi:hypothetical protein
VKIPPGHLSDTATELGLTDLGDQTINIGSDLRINLDQHHVLPPEDYRHRIGDQSQRDRCVGTWFGTESAETNTLASMTMRTPLSTRSSRPAAGADLVDRELHGVALVEVFVALRIVLDGGAGLAAEVLPGRLARHPQRFADLIPRCAGRSGGPHRGAPQPVEFGFAFGQLTKGVERIGRKRTRSDDTHRLSG